MGKGFTKFVCLLNSGFTILCMLHIFVNLHVTLNPPNPDIRVFDKALKDVSFPILFKLCGKEIRNSSERFKIFGYQDEINFFGGKSIFSKNVFGWNGHTENGSTIEIKVSGTNLIRLDHVGFELIF